jgi:uncharacterized protein YdeI (YjbR/CyaY-like superfamily)
VTAQTRKQWRAWLTEHHAASPGIWLVTCKKNSGQSHLPCEEVVPEALCLGWIDSLGRLLDEQRFQLLITPRKAGSNW